MGGAALAAHPRSRGSEAAADAETRGQQRHAASVVPASFGGGVGSGTSSSGGGCLGAGRAAAGVGDGAAALAGPGSRREAGAQRAAEAPPRGCPPHTCGRVRLRCRSSTGGGVLLERLPREGDELRVGSRLLARYAARAVGSGGGGGAAAALLRVARRQRDLELAARREEEAQEGSVALRGGGGGWGVASGEDR